MLIQEVINKKGLDFTNQSKVVMLRSMKQPDGKKLSFAKIAAKVRNLQGKATCEDVVRRVYERFNAKKGRVQYKFGRCGRKPWKLTKEVGSWLVRRLRQKRRQVVCTATTLQADLYKEKAVKLSTSAVRKHLFSKGYQWLSRAQKRKYSKEDMAGRKVFGGRYKNMSQKAIGKHITLAMDGVVLTIPPTDPVDRKNFCLHGDTMMYRLKSEAACPELAGDDKYAGQVPIGRALPLWGAISPAGFQEIVYHENRKLTAEEWTEALNSGKLLNAVRKLQPGRHQGPRRLLCDNESFIDAKLSRAYYNKKNLQMLHIPARCPDFNPIESFWGWLRRVLRHRDLEDLRMNRPPLGKTAYRQRVRSVLRSRKAQKVAAAKFSGFKGVCKEVWLKHGAASRQ